MTTRQLQNDSQAEEGKRAEITKFEGTSVERTKDFRRWTFSLKNRKRVMIVLLLEYVFVKNGKLYCSEAKPMNSLGLYFIC